MHVIEPDSVTHPNPSRALLRPLISIVVVVSALAGLLGLAAPAGAQDNPIVVENQQPGTTEWQLGRPGLQTANDVGKQIKGYASATSVDKGQSISFHVTTTPAQSYTIDIYRIGWYGGLGARLMQHVSSLEGDSQPACPTDAPTGLIECSWSPSYTITVPTTWTSGVYLALLTNAENYQNYVSFVVRDDTRTADFLYQLAVNTYEAYNNYPNDGVTGKSVYLSNSYGANTVTGTRRAVKVSFDRPFADSGDGQLISSQGEASLGGTGELDFIRWMERSGYDVSYSTDIDTQTSGSRLLSYRGFIAAGHDEYWSKEMRDAVEQARDFGVSLGFFSANDSYWQVRLEPSSGGVPNRVMVSYKNQATTLDPIQGPTTTVKWRNPPVNRPEQTMIGIQLVDGAAATLSNSAYTVTNSSSWVYSGSGFQDGDTASGIVGYEWDRFNPEYPYPANTSYTSLSHSPVPFGTGTDYAESSLYQAPSGALVFAAGTIWWGYGLNRAGLEDSRIQRTTSNLLDRFRRAKIVVVEDSAPDDPQDFTFTAGGGLSPSSFSLDDDADGTLQRSTTFDYVIPKTGYSLSQNLPSGWDLTSATCDDGSPVSTIDVSPGETVTCTFANRKRGQIVVREDSIPDNSQDFSFTAGGGLSPSSFQLDDDSNPTLSNTRTFVDVAPRSGYSIVESVPGGWDLAGATCDDGSSVSNIDVSPGETVTCIFTNKRRGRGNQK